MPDLKQEWLDKNGFSEVPYAMAVDMSGGERHWMPVMTSRFFHNPAIDVVQIDYLFETIKNKFKADFGGGTTLSIIAEDQVTLLKQIVL